MSLSKYLEVGYNDMILSKDYEYRLVQNGYTAFELAKVNFKNSSKQMKLQYEKRAKVNIKPEIKFYKKKSNLSRTK